MKNELGDDMVALVEIKYRPEVDNERLEENPLNSCATVRIAQIIQGVRRAINRWLYEQMCIF
jgi:hypothetical protein